MELNNLFAHTRLFGRDKQRQLEQQQEQQFYDQQQQFDQRRAAFD